jgi:hypothetical protein
VISRRQQLLWGALILVTGHSAPAYCQWIEITVTDPLVTTGGTPSGCDPTHAGNPGVTTYDSSGGPLSPALAQGQGLFVCQAQMPPWWVCSHGWQDFIEIRGGTAFGLSGWDADYSPDASSGDVHPGTARIAAVTAWGSFGGFDLASVNGQPATITRTGDTFVVYIGPEFSRADFDESGWCDVPDLMFFLGSWFARDLVGDWDASGGCEVADVFAYLADWFAAR